MFGGDADEALRLLFEANDRPMQHGLDLAFEAAEPGDEDFIDEFRYNTSVFDAFKAHQEREDLIAAMTDEKGNLRSFHQFRDAAKKITKDYNKRWLQTEYNTAVRAADNARYYRDALRTKDIYPNFEYRLSLAAHRREEHEAWVGTVLPIDHPWWDTHFPPSAWNCKCTVRKTDKPVTPVPSDGGQSGSERSERSSDIPASLSQNPGKTASPFNLAEHPYLRGHGYPNCPECRRQGLVQKGGQSEGLQPGALTRNSEDTLQNSAPLRSDLLADDTPGRTDEDALCPLHRIARLEEDLRRKMERYRGFEFGEPERFKSLGSFQKPTAEHYQNKSEQEKNERAFIQFAKLSGANVRALPVVNDGKKNPDGILLDTGEFVDVKVIDQMATKTPISNGIKDANQKASVALFDLRAGINSIAINKALYYSITPERNRAIEIVYFLMPDNELKKYEVKLFRNLIRKGKH